MNLNNKETKSLNYMLYYWKTKFYDAAFADIWMKEVLKSKRSRFDRKCSEDWLRNQEKNSISVERKNKITLMLINK